MGYWKELIKENPVITGATIVISLALLIPIVAIEPGIVAVLATFAFLTWLVARVTGSSTEETHSEIEETPIDELERQYIRGEITEAEFEHRLSVLLDADERTDRRQGTDRLQTRSRRQTERAHEQ